MEQTLAELRKGLKISQEELATIIGVSKGAIGMYETGKRTPSLHRAKQIAQFFGVTLEDLCFHNEPNVSKQKENYGIEPFVKLEEELEEKKEE